MADHRELVSTPIAEFVRDFGTVWAADPAHRRKTPSQHRIVFGRVVEMFASFRRVLAQDGTVTTDIISAPFLYADLPAAMREAETRKRAYLQRVIREHEASMVAAEKKLARQNEAGIMARLQRLGDADFAALRQAVKTAQESLTENQRKLSLLDCGDGISVVPLPATLEHYGRLDLGTKVWGVLTPKGDDRPKLISFTVTSEAAPDLPTFYSEAADNRKPVEMRYEARFDTPASQSFNATVKLGEFGLRTLSKHAIDFYTDRAQALAARDEMADSTAPAVAG